MVSVPAEQRMRSQLSSEPAALSREGLGTERGNTLCIHLWQLGFTDQAVADLELTPEVDDCSPYEQW